MTTFFEIRLLKFIIYSYYGYMFSWNKTMYNDSNYNYCDYEDSCFDDIDGYLPELSSGGLKRIHKVIGWLL